jgi:hypothetical protein
MAAQAVPSIIQLMLRPAKTAKALDGEAMRSGKVPVSRSHAADTHANIAIIVTM